MTRLVLCDRAGNTYTLQHTEISWTSRLIGNAGSLRFTVPYYDPVVEEGSAVDFVHGDRGVFFGYVFSVERDGDCQRVVCHDQIRYLLYRDIKDFSHKTAGEIVKEIAAERSLKTGSVADTGYAVSSLVCDNRTLLDVISDAIDQTAVAAGKRYVFFDDYRKLTLLDTDGSNLDLSLGSGNILSYSLQSDIDSDTYNRIKLAQAKGANRARETQVTQDDGKVGEWGTLQYSEIVSDELNRVQVREMMNTLLKKKSRPSRTLTLRCIGDVRCRAGYSPLVDLPDEDIYSYLLITDASHRILDGDHTMTLTLKMMDSD